jgi:hypothetical protein
MNTPRGHRRRNIRAPPSKTEKATDIRSADFPASSGELAAAPRKASAVATARSASTATGGSRVWSIVTLIRLRITLLESIL